MELIGEAGMGKSRLVGEILSDETTVGALRQVVVEGSAYGAASPYHAVSGPLRALLAPECASDAEVESTLAPHVDRHMPEACTLLPLVGLPLGLDLPATEESSRLTSAVCRTQLHTLLDRLLRQVLDERAALFVIEDAQWLDDASSDLLRAILRRTKQRGWTVIELTQLLVVALMMPSLYVLSRTAAYGVVRVAVALFGIVLSAAWLLERVTLIGSDPFAPVSTALAERPFVVAAAFAVLAAVAHYVPIPRTPSSGRAGRTCRPPSRRARASRSAT